MTFLDANLEIPQQIRDILNANDIDLTNRIDACSNTPLINPEIIPFIIDRISLRYDQEIFVCNDSHLCGGTKSRAGYSFLKEKVYQGYREFVYVSPWHGGAQVALPWLLNILEKEDGTRRKATIIIDAYPLTILNELPPYTKIGIMYGANIIQIPLDQDKFKFAEEYAMKHNALLVRPGFDYPDVVNKIGECAQQIVKQYGRFDSCYCAVGSGTLIRGLQSANIANEYFGVCIFNYCPDIGTAVPIIHYQGHNEPVRNEDRPPFHSSMFYDAKVFQYVKNRPGKILLWNVM